MFMKPLLSQGRKVGSVGISVLSKSFLSTPQTITQAALVTLPHGMNVKPRILQFTLVCTTAEHGYAIDDEIVMNVNRVGASSGNLLSVKKDATNITIRYGDGAGGTSVFTYANATTGAVVNLTDANWDLIVEAFA